MLAQPAALGLTAAGAIGLLIFAGAAGKSGQFPLHVWLPDAMEGPTPVSALIHAATMVAAGVYLVARVYPLMQAGALAGGTTTALTVVTWVGAFTAVFAALIAVAQNDIKRILAYSTVSQLGYMMAGLGMGGVAVGMFHLITHAFFKALLVPGRGLGDSRLPRGAGYSPMGGLKSDMPLTFLTYAIGMLALCGFPLLFSGFWSKDGILEAAQHWSVAKTPFYMLVFGALLTAFYMTRQVAYVFFGHWRGGKPAHESPTVMTRAAGDSGLLRHGAGSDWNAGMAVVPRLSGWPRGWLRSAWLCRAGAADADGELRPWWSFSGLGWAGGSTATSLRKPEEPDALEQAAPLVWGWLRDRLYVDEFYGVTVIAFYGWWARVADWLDRRVWGGLVAGVAWALRPVGAVESLSRYQCGGRRLRQGLRGAGRRRRPAGAGAERARADLPENSGAGRGGAGRNSDLEQPGMSGFPILTLLTVLPLVGAAIALFSGKHARGVALVTTLAGLALALVVWTQLPAGRRLSAWSSSARVGAVAGHRVPPRRRRAGRADAGALGDCHADVRGRGASRASSAGALLRAGAVSKPGSSVRLRR